MICIYKNVGETPLEALTRLREKKPEFKHAVLSYAGRLDPMAEGILLVLVGNENKNRKQYLNLDKTYEAEMILGIETDTYDILGKITKIDTSKNIFSEKDIKQKLEKYIGTFQQEYPPYSSKTVDGKPLFEWARSGKIHEISLPTREVHIQSIKLLSLTARSAKKIEENVHEKIKLVKGDFRQEEIEKLWTENIEKVSKSAPHFQIAKILVSGSSGTYVRSLIHRLGKDLEVGAVTKSIKRTQIGHYSTTDCISL